jgi:hypothetical protein
MLLRGSNLLRTWELAADRELLRTCRDTKNPTWHTKERRFGDMATTMLLAHGPPDADCFSKPQFASKPIIRDTFYRRTNVQFPDKCAAVNVSDA